MFKTCFFVGYILDIINFITFGISLCVHIGNVQILNDLHRQICLSNTMQELNIQFARKKSTYINLKLWLQNISE